MQLVCNDAITSCASASAVFYALDYFASTNLLNRFKLHARTGTGEGGGGGGYKLFLSITKLRSNNAGKVSHPPASNNL